jgi:hypothetical protein
MCPPHPPRPTLRFAVALAALVASGTLGAFCGPDQHVLWFCLNPATGKEDETIHDDSHFVNGEPDPCHCYDPCGEADTCPILVDAGPPPLGCEAGDGGL